MSLDNLPKILGPFTSLGVDFVERSDVNYIADCPFTGKSRKLYVNGENGQWICHSAEGRRGNVWTFMEQYVAARREETTADDWRRLAKRRKLPRAALQAEPHGLAWDAAAGRWLIPIRNPKGSVVDVRKWSEKTGLRSLKGVHTCLWGADRLAEADPGSEVWVCEGEWDGIAGYWLEEAVGTGAVVVAVPGAGVWKDDWTKLLTRRRVRLFYDADKAGREGAVRTWRKIKGAAKKVVVRDWPDDADDGYDLRDYVGANWEEPDRAVIALTSTGAVDDKELEKRWRKLKDRDAADDGEPVEVSDEPLEVFDWDGVARTFAKHLYMTPKMNDALRLTFAVAASVCLGGPNPLWLFVVGPAGSGKTELLSCLDGMEAVEYVSSLSPKSLVSGFNLQGTDPSLLARLNQRVLVLKDFTEVHDMHANDQKEVFSVLRGAYDGRVDRAYGNGIVRSYSDLWFSCLAGVTDVIHSMRNAAVGERFLKYNLGAPSRALATDVAIKAMGSLFAPEKRSEELKKAAAGYLLPKMDKLANGGTELLPRLSRAQMLKVYHLGVLIAVLRTEVPRDFRGDVSARPFTETSNRISQQLCKLVVMLAYMGGRKEVEDVDWQLMQDVALDTAQGWHFDILEALFNAGRPVNLNELAESAALPRSTLHRRVEDACLIGLVMKEKQGGGSYGRGLITYEPSPRVAEAWKGAGLGG